MTASVFDQHDRAIRERIRDMKPTERVPYIRDAIINGDKATVDAVLAGPSFTSGLSDRDLEVVKILAAAKAGA